MDKLEAERTIRVGRPRDDRASTEILAAAHVILQERGLGGFTVEAVAAKAGVAKTTIYRWWPSKGALAVASLLTAVLPRLSFATDGPVIPNLKDQLRRVAELYSGPAGRMLSAIVAEGQRDPNTIAAFIEGFARPRREDAKAMLRLGIVRGELRADIDLEVALDALYGPIYYRMLVPHAPLDGDWMARLADHVLDGLRAPPAARG